MSFDFTTALFATICAVTMFTMAAAAYTVARHRWLPLRIVAIVVVVICVFVIAGIRQ